MLIIQLSGFTKKQTMSLLNCHNKIAKRGESYVAHNDLTIEVNDISNICSLEWISYTSSIIAENLILLIVYMFLVGLLVSYC